MPPSMESPLSGLLEGSPCPHLSVLTLAGDGLEEAVRESGSEKGEQEKKKSQQGIKNQQNNKLILVMLSFFFLNTANEMFESAMYFYH